MDAADRLERAMEGLQRNTADNARSIAALTEHHGSLALRVTALEQSQRAREVQEARDEEREKATAEWRTNMVERMAKIEANYEEGRQYVTKLLFRFIVFFASAIGLALLAFVAKRVTG